MHFKQFYLGCLAHASYLVADEESGVAIVVDPQRDIAQYLAQADRHGLRIEHVFLTHFHADFVAGHLELRERVGAQIHLSAKAQAEYDFVPVREGQALELGQLRLEFLETPGHTSEAISILLFDRARSETQPRAVLTGDTLFVGDVGRPDLSASVGVTARELASLLYDSLHEKLLRLPDATLVWPAHGAGSLCGRQLGAQRVSTIGEQRRDNPALQAMSREAFVELITSDNPDAPPYFAFDAALNRRERATLDAVLRSGLEPLSLQAVLGMEKAGALVLDVREAHAFAGGHLAGSINIPLASHYATWAGSLLDPERGLVLVAEPSREREAATRLGRIGYDTVLGYLEGGLSALDERPELIERLSLVSARALHEQLDCEQAPWLLDVRTAAEWGAGHLRGSVNIPLQRLQSRLLEVPREREIVLLCQTGERSTTAASLLAVAGIRSPRHLVGGVEIWQAMGFELLRARSGQVA